MFFPPVLLIRRRQIVTKLEEKCAFSPETAVTLKDAGVRNPYAMKRLNQILIRCGILGCAEEERYYLIQKP